MSPCFSARPHFSSCNSLGGGRLTASDSNQEVSEAIVSSRVIAQHEPVELIEQRDDHTRVWEIAKEVETTHPDSSATVETVKSYIHEKGSGLCYRDASGNFVPCVAEWREVPDGFVIDRCGYWLSVGKSIGSGLRYVVEGHELLLRAAYLMISDGTNEAHLAVLNLNATGFIVPGSASVVRFPSAFGQGYDLEYVAEKGGFHQNLIIAGPPRLPAEFDASGTTVHLYTEMSLDQYLAASGLKVSVEGEEINAAATDLLSPVSRGGCISFCRSPGAPGEPERMVHAFCISSVADSARAGTFPKESLAEKRILKNGSTRAVYLVESLPFSYFVHDTAPAYPVVWDYQNIYEPISGGTWEPRYTYRVSGNIYIEGTLTILPGTTVKLDPLKKISIVSGGKVIAKGEPYNYVTFSNSSDSNCGETIPGAPSGRWDRLEIQSGSSSASIVQYCRFGHGNIGIDLRQTFSEGSRVEHNIFNDMNYAMQIQYCSATVHNNLMASCTYAIYTNGIGTGVFSNNTIDNMAGGILDGGSSVLVVKDGLFSNSPNGTGIYTYNSSADIHHNRFFNVHTWIVGPPGHDNQGLDNDPYDHGPAVGGYFLSSYGAENLKNAGSRYANEEPRLDGEVFAIRAPVVVYGTLSGAVTWSKICYDGQGQPYSIDTGPVCIGYHHNRVDCYVSDNCTISGSGNCLTILPGVVVGVCGNKYIMVTGDVNGGGKFVSIGNPSAGGLNLFTNSKSLSMNIESPRFGVTGVNPFILIDSSASEDTSIQFTRTMWMGWGILINLGRHLSQPIRDNIFSLSYMGIHAGLYSGNTLLNNLIHENVRGVYAWGNGELANCTFDRNQTGLEVGADAGQKFTIRDSLFTKNSSQGILINASSGEVVNYYNGFWENGVPITGGSPGPGSQVLAQSPYDAGIESGWQLHYKLKQDGGWPVTNSPVNAGSRWAPDPLEGPHPYSTSVYAERDVGRIDIGFHFTFYDNIDGDNLPDAWETHFFGNLDQGDNSIFGDSDNLTALQEFWHGSSPKAPDSDGDGYADDQEVGPRADVEASRKLCRGWGPAVYDFKAGPWLTNLTWSQEASWGVTIGWWVSDTPSHGAPRVYYKKESELTFNEVQLQEPNDVRDHSIEGKVFEKRLTGLVAATTYQYYVTCTVGGSSKASPVCRFRALEASPSSFSFIVYGDSRSCPGGPNGDPRHMPGHNDNGFNEYTAQVARGILSKVPEAAFLLHVGDYPENQAGGAVTAEHWRQHFFLPSTRLVAEYPLFAALGNHERGDSAAGLKYFEDFFDYPGDLNPDNPSGVLVRYNFDYANCRFICLDTNDWSTFPSQKNDFLIPLLSSAGTKRIFVWFHHPPFTSGPNRGTRPCTDVRTVFVPEFQTYGAEMVFAGHDHSYERARNETMNTVRYIVTGGAGAPLSEIKDLHTYPPAVREAWYARGSEEDPGWGTEDAFHFCVVQVTPSSFNLKAYKWDGTQKDQWP